MDAWTPVGVLPNIELASPIDAGEIALVAGGDERVTVLCAAHPRLASFLGRFSDAFGQEVLPAVMLVRQDAPPSVLTVEALASFRDAVALSVVTSSRALGILYPRGHQISFSNAFGFYPWMLDKDYEHLIASTPAMLALHDVEEFHGQCSPELVPIRLTESNIDRTLLTALCREWRRSYLNRRSKWRHLALFRSLNMANQASLLPAGRDVTFYDVGRSIALWVSAFEILSHPGKGKVSIRAVYDLLEKVEWNHKALRQKRYKAHETSRKTSIRRIAPCWLYGEIHRARNNFLHGNPVKPARLIVKRARRSVFQYAAPLYRMALAGFLPLTWSRPSPSTKDIQALPNTRPRGCSTSPTKTRSKRRLRQRAELSPCIQAHQGSETRSTGESHPLKFQLVRKSPGRPDSAGGQHSAKLASLRDTRFEYLNMPDVSRSRSSFLATSIVLVYRTKTWHSLRRNSRRSPSNHSL